MRPLRTLLLAGLTLAGSAQLTAQDARVFIVHGIPGQDVGLDPDLPVDVSVDGACTLAGFRFGEITDPFFLPAANYHIQISLANETAPCTNPPLIDVDVDLLAGETATIIAHLDEAFGLTASKFTNDAAATDFLQSRFVVHHTAAVPAVDVTIERADPLGDGHVFVPNVTNGLFAGVDRFFGFWSLSLAPAGTGQTVLGPETLFARPGFAYFAYVVGSLDNETAQVITLRLRARG